MTAVGRPVLLLVEPDADPPAVGPLEDWVRVPSSAADITARIEALRSRVEATDDGQRPVLGEDGVIRFGSQRVSLSPLEGRLVAAFLERPGAVIPRQHLLEAGWGGVAIGAGPSRNALDTQVLRLRRRLRPLGLTVRTIRARGYVLDVVDPQA